APGGEGPGALGAPGRSRPARNRHPAALGEGPSGRLVAEKRERLGSRSDEGEPRLGAPPGEGRLLAQETVAGMDGVAPGVACHHQELLDVEVGARTAS